MTPREEFVQAYVDKKAESLRGDNLTAVSVAELRTMWRREAERAWRDRQPRRKDEWR